MSDKKTATQEDIQKAIAAVAALGGETLSKGHSSKGTVSTEVESMTGESGSPQVHHTPSNSNPKTWAGSTEETVAENGATDSISENGTDMERAIVKAIVKRIQKGLPVSKEEKEMAKAALFGKEDKDKDGEKDGDKDDKKPFGKSLNEVVQENPALKDSLEVSDFLAEWNGSISKALSGGWDRLEKSMDARIGEFAASQADYNKNLAKALVPILDVVKQLSQRVEQVETSPARGAKSTVRTEGDMSKSLDGGGSDLTKSQIINHMFDMIKSQECDPTSVVTYESTGRLTPELAAKIMHRARNGK
jgi:hypothetical protein